MPREPDLGLGRPGAATELVPKATGHHKSVCDGHAQACATSLSLLDSFQDKAIRGLAAVKADIEANRKPFTASNL